MKDKIGFKPNWDNVYETSAMTIKSHGFGYENFLNVQHIEQKKAPRDFTMTKCIPHLKLNKNTDFLELWVML